MEGSIFLKESICFVKAFHNFSFKQVLHTPTCLLVCCVHVFICDIYIALEFEIRKYIHSVFKPTRIVCLIFIGLLYLYLCSHE